MAQVSSNKFMDGKGYSASQKQEVDAETKPTFPQYKYTKDGIEVQVTQKSFLPGYYTNIMQAELGYARYLGLCAEHRAGKQRSRKEKDIDNG